MPITSEATPDAEEDAEEPETGPLRRCIVTRERLAKEVLVRFVVDPDRRLVPDIAGRLPGRGIWLSARRDVLETGRRPNASDGRPQTGATRHPTKLAAFFARAAKGPVTLPDDLPAVLRTALERRIGELLGLARRAGQAVSGFEKARDWIRAGRVGAIVQASDGSASERERFVSPETVARLGVPLVAPLDAAALGVVFGRERCVHVVLAPGKLAEAVTIEATRLAGILGSSGLDNNGAEANSASSGVGKTHR